MPVTLDAPRVRARPSARQFLSAPLKNGVLLTHAYYLSMTRNDRRAMEPYAPLGPLYVAAYLRQLGCAVHFHDTTFEHGIAGFAGCLDRLQPALVGISTLDTTRRNAGEMIRQCRQRGIPVVAGGPDASADPQYYLARGVRVVVAGEGEETMAELAAARKSNAGFDGIAGTVTRAGAGGSRPAFDHLDDLPFPAYGCVDHGAYFAAWKKRHGFTSMQLSVSRGCPCHCSWCAKPVYGSARRIRSAKNLVEEMLFVKMLYRPDRIRFNDDLFSADPAWVQAFSDEVSRMRARIPFECVSRVDLVDEAVLAALRAAGCFRIWYGVESGSQKILEHLGKDFNVDDVRRAAVLTRQAGIEVGYYLMLGHPAEKVADVELTRRLVRDTRPDRCSVALAYPQKGSGFYREVEDRFLPVRYGERVENDNILTFKSRYSQNFYDMARRCIGSEAAAAVRPTLAARARYGVCRLGYQIMKSGVV